MTGNLTKARSALVAAATSLLAPLAPPASAQAVTGWQHDSEAGVEFAYFSADTSELAIRCRDGAVEVVYYLDSRALDPALQGLPAVDLAFIVDASTNLIWIPSNVIIDGGVIQLGVGNDVANNLAHDFAAATSSIVVSVFATTPTATSTPYNKTQFAITGAAAAIKAAYSACGIKF